MTDSLETRTPAGLSSNFEFLEVHDEQLVRYGQEAERYVRSSANTCPLKLRQFAELLAQIAAAQTGCFELGESFAHLLNRLFENRVLPAREAMIFHSLRKAGNAASHSHDGREDILQSRKALEDARELGIWFHRTFGEDPDYRPEPFVVPPDPAALPKDMERVAQHVLDEGRKRKSAEERAEWETRQRAIWERRAIEAERQRNEIEQRLQRLQAALSFEIVDRGKSLGVSTLRCTMANVVGPRRRARRRLPLPTRASSPAPPLSMPAPSLPSSRSLLPLPAIRVESR